MSAKKDQLSAAERRELNRLRKLFKERTAARGDPRPESPPEPQPTGRQFYFQQCPHCNGSGRVPDAVGSWFINYHYQDGHEQSQPMTKEEAVATILAHRERGGLGGDNLTLIGPDGKVYTVS